MAVVLGLSFKWFHHSPEQHEQYRTQKAGNGLCTEDVFNKFKLWSTGGTEHNRAHSAEMTHSAMNHIN